METNIGNGLKKGGFIRLGKDTWYESFKGRIKDFRFYYENALTSE